MHIYARYFNLNVVNTSLIRYNFLEIVVTVRSVFSFPRYKL